MKNDLDLYNYNPSKYVDDINYLIKFSNYLLMIFKHNTHDYDNIKFYKLQTNDELLLKIITIDYSLIDNLKSLVIDMTKKFNLLLYQKKMINYDKYTKYNENIFRVIRNCSSLFLYVIKYTKFLKNYTLITVNNDTDIESSDNEVYNI